MPEITITLDGQELTYPTKKEMLQLVSKHILSKTDDPMTLRQLYYRFVALDLIENKQSQYQYLGEAVKEARLAGDIPWGWIEDRTRGTDAGDHNDGSYVEPMSRYRGNLQWFKDTPERFHRPRWQYQPTYVEVWVEKEALAGVFANVASDLKVVSFPNRGYTSITMLKEAADRIQAELDKTVRGADERSAKILYFGDYDPSGQDIERNIRDKLSGTFGVDVGVDRYALTRDQIDKFELPPQPAKRTDSRYESFVEEHGDMAVELDALPPDRLRALIREAVETHFDTEVYENHVEPREADEKERLRKKIDAVLDE